MHTIYMIGYFTHNYGVTSFVHLGEPTYKRDVAEGWLEIAKDGPYTQAQIVEVHIANSTLLYQSLKGGV